MNCKIIIIDLRGENMKKIFSILLSGAFLLTLAICLTGCKGIVTEGQMKSMVEKTLEEKYKEEFKCISILPNKNFSGSYTGVCYPMNDKELMFEAGIYTDGSPDGDYYPTSIAARELSKMFDEALCNGLGKHFTYAYTSLGVHDNETAQKIINDKFTLDYFLKHNNEVYNRNNLMQVNFNIIVDASNASNSYEEEWDAILNALDSVHEIGLASGIDLYFRLWIYFVPTNVYTQCLGYFERNAEVRSGLDEIAEGFPSKYNRIIHFDVGSETWTPLTKEEYIELRKEID